MASLPEALVTLAIRIAGAALAFGLQAFLARLMTQGEYGHFVMVWTWILALGSFASLGLAEVALLVLPRYATRMRHAALRGFFNHGLRTTASVAAALALLGMAVASALPIDHTTRQIVLGVCLGLPMLALEFFLEGVARAMGWFRITTVTVYLVRPLMIALGAGLLWLNGTPLSGLSVTALLAFCLALTSIGLALIMRRRLMLLSSGQTPSAAMQRFWMRQSVPMLLASGLDDVLAYADVILLGLLLTPADAAVYFVASRVLMMANLTQYAFYFVAARSFSVALAENGASAAEQRMWHATRNTVVTTALAVALTIALSPWLLDAFGPGYTGPLGLVAILGLAQVARSFAGQASELLLVCGKVWHLLIINSATLVLFGALLPVLLHAWALAGAGFAMALALAARSCAILLLVRGSGEGRATSRKTPVETMNMT
jgi:O-antigen/teichoic acid export membrane protein